MKAVERRIRRLERSLARLVVRRNRLLRRGAAEPLTTPQAQRQLGAVRSLNRAAQRIRDRLRGLA